MENLNVLLEIISELREQNKELTKQLEDKTESTTFWFNKYEEIKEQNNYLASCKKSE